MKQKFALTLTVSIIVIALIGTGCLGRFATFNKLSDWNQTVTDNKFVNEIVFLAMNIIPVYGVALFADAVIFNSIEFWTGENPMMTEGEYKKTVRSGEDQAVQTFRHNGDQKTMTVDYYSKGELTQTLMLWRNGKSSEFHGISVSASGKVENFNFQTRGSGLVFTRYHQDGGPVIEMVQGPALQSITSKIAGLLSPPRLELVSAR